MMGLVRVTAFSLAVIALFSHIASAQLPFQLKENFISGLSSPVFLTNAGDGTRRLFIVQQRGIIKVAQPGSSTVTDYLNLSSVVSSTGSERGLLGLAFHPNFENNRRFFVYYTRQSDGGVEIAEYAQNAVNRNIADPNPVKIILTIPHPDTTHNGGTIAFGPDGYLYAGPGDGGGANDPNANAQNLDVLLGKVLRIDIDNVSAPLNYSIPPTNPFAGETAGRDEIYAYGLRNPYRFSFDRSGTNQLWLGDVGQAVTEEVNIIVSGANYGWRVYEGTRCTELDIQLCSIGSTPINHTPPVFEYSRTLDGSGQNRCSVTGGYVYRGKQNALPLGGYVYGDYCTGEIMVWNGSQQTVLRDTSNLNLVSFGEDEDGELYVVRQHTNFAPNSGSIARIVGKRTNADFDGDGGSDFSVFRPEGGEWHSFSPISGAGISLRWGISIDRPVPEDYDGDGKTDHAVFRPNEGMWYVFRSSDFTVMYVRWGVGSDIPAPGDFTGDRRSDFAVFRPSEGVWYVLRNGTWDWYSVRFGLAVDVPVNADYDGDGKDDIAIWRTTEGNWWRINSSNGSIRGYRFGLPTDIPAQADYDGDGRTDEGVYRPDTGEWFFTRSSNSTFGAVRWGVGEDIPVPGDYDRDGRDDVAVFRPSSRYWWVLKSSDPTYSSILAMPYGVSSDLPLSSIDKP